MQPERNRSQLRYQSRPRYLDKKKEKERKSNPEMEHNVIPHVSKILKVKQFRNIVDNMNFFKVPKEPRCETK
jgi:hypothetical protein